MIIRKHLVFRLALCAALVLSLARCASQKPFTEAERQLIIQSDSLMHVTVFPQDSVFLRTPSVDLGPAELGSPELETLLAKMLYTVRHPSQDGIGIAAPQVGIGRRVICLQRFDKEGEPFEAYLNVQIDSLAGEVEPGPEGCLSVPGMRGIVPRHRRIVVSYIRPGATSIEDRMQECVEGYTAVVFQHECDHLDGILYIDRATVVFFE